MYIVDTQRRKGFTLIELLVVIAIITILAAILFPVFAAAREKARESTCSSNLKQIGIAMLQYAQDYDEFLPCGTRPTGYLGLGWAGQMYPYVSSVQVFACPNVLGRPGVAPTKPNIYLGYRYNTNLTRNNQLSSDLTGLRPLSKYTAPSRTVMIYESESSALDVSTYWEGLAVGYNGNNGSAVGNGEQVNASGVGVPNGTSMLPTANWTYSLPTQATYRHNGGANWLCADGHVKWLTPERVSYGYSAASSTAVGYFTGGTGTLFADGSEYINTATPHDITMSCI
jgi:prepilin-type N-terminal cleavage/methylation domain-containing protein/prepilin-type processing-associated H-X9-DG protein